MSKEIRKLVEQVNRQRRLVRDAVKDAVGPQTEYEMAARYGTSRDTIAKILDGKHLGQSRGRKAKVRSGAEAQKLIEADYRPLTSGEYLEAIKRAVEGLDI